MTGDDRVDTRTSFIDMLLSGQMNLFVIFMMALLLISPQKRDSGNVQTKAEFVITVTWADSIDCDVDLWVRGPNDKTAWWKNKDVGGMYIDRDDTGMANDTQVIDGVTYPNPTNEEVWSMRGVVPGEYVVNVHSYRAGDHVACADLAVRVVLSKVNPSFSKVVDKTVILAKEGQEGHAFRFSVTPAGTVSRVWEEPVEIVSKHLTTFPGIGAIPQ